MEMIFSDSSILRTKPQITTVINADNKQTNKINHHSSDLPKQCQVSVSLHAAIASPKQMQREDVIGYSTCHRASGIKVELNGIIDCI